MIKKMRQKLDSRTGSPAVKSRVLFINNCYSFNKRVLNVCAVLGIQRPKSLPSWGLIAVGRGMIGNSKLYSTLESSVLQM